ncbi:MAG TPA: pyridoxal 5'-phosphate synthase, partial [Prolixibacteraceae bacterium]|nr:pyridoxal 5'-phosphate synthase [Prolixibacteraceae bacterium]
MNIHSIRNEYQQGELTAENLERDPFVQFEKWLQEAVSQKVAEPTAMALATVGRDGFPQVRTVLLKSFGAGGFVFFTNLESEKGQAIAADNRVSLLFFWPELQRQVRITGSAERVSDAEADEYFRTRPVNSRLGAWASE